MEYCHPSKGRDRERGRDSMQAVCMHVLSSARMTHTHTHTHTHVAVCVYNADLPLIKSYSSCLLGM